METKTSFGEKMTEEYVFSWSILLHNMLPPLFNFCFSRARAQEIKGPQARQSHSLTETPVSREHSGLLEGSAPAARLHAPASPARFRLTCSLSFRDLPLPASCSWAPTSPVRRGRRQRRHQQAPAELHSLTLFGDSGFGVTCALPANPGQLGVARELLPALEESARKSRESCCCLRPPWLTSPVPRSLRFLPSLEGFWRLTCCCRPRLASPLHLLSHRRCRFSSPGPLVLH